MNFNQISDKVSANGFRRCTRTHEMRDDEGNLIQIIDFEHRKKLDMFSVYLDEFGGVLYAEYTKVNFDQQTRKFSQKVTRIENMKELAHLIG